MKDVVAQSRTNCGVAIKWKRYDLLPSLKRFPKPKTQQLEKTLAILICAEASKWFNY